MTNELVRRDSIEELCGHRARALQLYAQALDTFVAARMAHARAVIGKNGHISSLEIGGRAGVDEGQFAKEARLAVDRDIWRGFIVGTPLGSLMDTQERKKFQDSLKGDTVPDATIENVFATMSRLGGEADLIFRRGLVNAFARFNRDYKSHDGFKIGERIVLTCCVHYEKNCNWLRSGYRVEEELTDIDRVMHVLDGKGAPEYQQGLAAALRSAVSAWRDGGKMECESEYWRLRFFKNGNGHLFPKRKDLVDAANRLIAEHYGQVVGAAPNVAKNNPMWGDKSPVAAAKADFFATPEWVAKRMVRLAGIEAHHTVLEPSAGAGGIAVHAAKIVGCNLTCYEMNPGRAAECKTALANLGGLVINGDFLESPADNLYDIILMNPPFSENRDITHTLQAWARLKPGGTLVAITSLAPNFRKGDAADLLRSLVAEHGEIESLEAGTFKESGTMIETQILVMNKPAQTNAPAVQTDLWRTAA